MIECQTQYVNFSTPHLLCWNYSVVDGCICEKIIFVSPILVCHGDFWLTQDNGVSLSLSAGTKKELFDLADHPEYYSKHSAAVKSISLESLVVCLDVRSHQIQKLLSKEIYK